MRRETWICGKFLYSSGSVLLIPERDAPSSINNFMLPSSSLGFPGGASGKESTCQGKKHEATRVQSLSREDPLEEEMATHSSILAWRIPWREEPGGLQSMGSQKVRHNWSGLAHMHILPTLGIWAWYWSEQSSSWGMVFHHCAAAHNSEVSCTGQPKAN